MYIVLYSRYYNLNFVTVQQNNEKSTITALYRVKVKTLQSKSKPNNPPFKGERMNERLKENQVQGGPSSTCLVSDEEKKKVGLGFI